MNTAEWAKVPVALRNRAFMSARVENAQFLQASRDFLNGFLRDTRVTLPDGREALKAGGRAQFVREMQKKAMELGLGPLGKTPITDVRNESRLKLIFDTNRKAAQDYGNFKQGMDPDVLNEFPCQRFIRVARVDEPRPSHEAHKGEVHRKDDLQFWIDMNPDFGVPWGPWGFNSQMGVEDVGRDEAESMGLVQPGEVIQPKDADFNRDLSASVAGIDPDILHELKHSLGDAAEIDESKGRIRWTGTNWKPDSTSPTPPRKPKQQPQPKEEAAPRTRAFPTDPNALEDVRSLGGSTGAKLVRDASTGELYVRKRGATPAHIREETAADAAYSAMGVRVPEGKLYETPDGPVKLTRYIEGQSLKDFLSKATSAQRAEILAQIQRDLGADALLGNWDVVGAGLDNILVDKAGAAWRIDNGGSLRFRAQGAPKSAEDFGEYVPELWSMRGKAFNGYWSSKPPDPRQVEIFGGSDFYTIAQRWKSYDKNTILAAVPEEIRPTVAARFDNLDSVMRKAREFQATSWKSDYADDLGQHMMALRKEGIIKSLPKELKQSPESTHLIDEHGKPFDDLRTSGAIVADIKNVSDPYYAPVTDAIKTINHHVLFGDAKWNTAKIAAAKQALTDLAASSDAGIKSHYADAAKKLSAAISAIESGKNPIPVNTWVMAYNRPAGGVEKPLESIPQRLESYLKKIGAENGIKAIDAWMSSHAGHSWDSQAQAYKAWIATKVSIPAEKVWWRNRKSTADTHLAQLTSLFPSAEVAFTARHALVQEILATVDTRYNDRRRRLVRLVRTEQKDIVKKNGLKIGTQCTFPRGLNESTSIFQRTTVHGTENFVYILPHIRITDLYMFERSNKRGSSSFLSDSENEYTAVIADLPAFYVKNVRFDDPSRNAEDWGFDLSETLKLTE